MLALIHKQLNELYNFFAHIIFRGKYFSAGNARFYAGGGVAGNASAKSILLDKNVKIAGWLITEGDGVIKVGKYTSVNERCVIRAREGVEIGDFVLISSDVYIQDNNSHSIFAEDREKEILADPAFGGKGTDQLHNPETRPVKIGNHVWIGRRSMIMKGVTIGDRSIVGAGSIVTKDVPAGTVVAGNPAVVVKEIYD